jgi:hypothetical protein
MISPARLHVLQFAHDRCRRLWRTTTINSWLCCFAMQQFPLICAVTLILDSYHSFPFKKMPIRESPPPPRLLAVILLLSQRLFSLLCVLIWLHFSFDVFVVLSARRFASVFFRCHALDMRLVFKSFSRKVVPSIVTLLLFAIVSPVLLFDVQFPCSFVLFPFIHFPAIATGLSKYISQLLY